MSNYVGDFAPASTVTIYFTTVAAATGLPTALAGAATAACYKGSTSSGATAGVTLAVTFGSNAGHNNISIDTSQDATFYAAGSDYAVSLTSGSVGGTAVLGYNVGHFSLNNRGIRANVIQVNGSAAATSAAQLGVNVVTLAGAAIQQASGFAQVNLTQWEGIAPLGLSSQLVQATASLAGVTSTAQFGVNLVTIGGAPVATSSAQLGVNLVTVGGAAVAAASGILQTNTVQWLGPAPLPLTAGLAVQSAQVGNIAGSVGSVVGAVGSVTGAVGSVTGAVGSVTGNVGGNVVGSVASVTARVTANTDQIAGVTVNALISGRVDVSVGQVQTSAIGPAAYVAGALGTTVFASQFLTSALVDTTYPNALADALLDRSNAVETAITPRKALRYTTAAAAGALSGAGTTNINIWGVGVPTTRITAITDQSGNRASVTLA